MRREVARTRSHLLDAFGLTALSTGVVEHLNVTVLFIVGPLKREVKMIGGTGKQEDT